MELGICIYIRGTLNKDVLQNLGIEHGEMITMNHHDNHTATMKCCRDIFRVEF